MEQSKQSLAVRVAILAIVILGISGWAWWHYVLSAPTKVFDRMLDTMLTTPSVTKSISQSEGGQKLDQVIQITVHPEAQIHARNVLQQPGNTTVTTESLGTRTTDFVRYNSIVTDQKSASGKEFDFSGVTGTWGKLASNEDEGAQAQLFSQNVMGVVPVANLTLQARQQLLKSIKDNKVYNVNYDTVKREIVNKRPVYTYEVTVEPVAYIGMLKEFAKTLGLRELDDVDPAQYNGTPALKFDFAIDVWSGQLNKITYKDSGRVETYGSYGARVVVPEPDESIEFNELQGRLQQIQ